MFADGESIESANIVGYVSVGTVSGGQYVPLATQFEDASGTAIAVKSVLAVSPAQASASMISADQIWRWDTASSSWTKYYYYAKPRSTSKYWVQEGSTTETTDTIPAGETFFFKRSSGATTDASLTLSGGVKDLSGSSAFTVAAAQLAFVGNPWPIEIAVKDFGSYVTSGSLQASASMISADQIWLWDTAANAWTKYYYYAKPRSTSKYWVAEGSTTETDGTIPVGKGIFFKRSSGATASLTVTFTKN